MRTNLSQALAAIALTALLAGPAAAKNSVPFKGSIDAVESTFVVLPPDVPFPTLFVEGSGSGHASHLGRFSVDYEFEINLDNFTGGGSTEFVGARGDSFTTYSEGQGTVPTADGVSFIVEWHVITSGTGQFEGATGAFVVMRVLNVFTHDSSGSFEGTIQLQ